MKKLILPLLALTATFATGFWLGRITFSRTPGASAPERDTSSQSPYALPPLQTPERTAPAGGANLSVTPTQKLSVEQIAVGSGASASAASGGEPRNGR